MAVTDTVAAATYILKRKYMPGKIAQLTQRNHPFYNQVRKDPRFTGEDMRFVTKYANPQGVTSQPNAAGFVAAQNADSVHKGVQWALDRSRKISYHTVEGELLMATADNEGSFIRAITYAIDSVLEEHGNKLAFDLAGDGTGKLAEVSTYAAGPPVVITVTDAKDMYKFSVGQTIGVYDTTLATLRGTKDITAVNRGAGTITLSAAVAGTVATDLLINVGDYTAGTGGNVISGIGAWVPATAPTSTAFFGIDRTADTELLGGHRLAATAMDLDEAILDICAEQAKWGARVDRIWMSPTNWNTLVAKLDQKVERMPGGGAVFGFDAIRVATPAGTALAVPDPSFPENRVYCTDMRSIFMKHLGSLPHMAEDDGRQLMRVTDDDGIEFRARSFSQLGVSHPGRNGVITL